MVSRLGMALFAGLILTLATACGEGSGAGPSSNGGAPLVSMSPGAGLLALPPPGTVYLGVFANPNQVPAPPPSILASFETSIGRTLALSTHYYGFFDDFPGTYEADDVAHGRIPIDSWDCQPANATVAAGNDDTAIRKRADAIKAFGHPIFLRYMWEMNLPSNSSFRHICYDANTDLPNGYFSPQQYIAAWDRIRAIFGQENVTNVIWLWNPSGAKNPLNFYPGSNEVDWVGFDRYNDGNVSMSATYTQPYGWLAPLGKPIMIGETGATQQVQQAFFGSGVSTLKTQFPLIRGFMYFDSLNIHFAGSYSWVIDSANLPTFATMANDPYFSAMPPP